MAREYDHQVAIVEYMKVRGLTYHHSPLGGKDKGHISRSKAMGAVSGFPDLVVFNAILACPTCGLGPQGSSCPHDSESWLVEWVGLAIELKRPSLRPKNPAQRELVAAVKTTQLAWLGHLRLCGWRAEICYGAGEAIELLRTCYGTKPNSIALAGLSLKRRQQKPASKILARLGQTQPP